MCQPSSYCFLTCTMYSESIVIVKEIYGKFSVETFVLRSPAEPKKSGLTVLLFL